MKTKNIFYLYIGLATMSGFYSDIIYGSGPAQISVARNEPVKRVASINIGDRLALDLYLNGIPLDSRIVLSIADVHGYHENYPTIIEHVRYIKTKGFSKVYMLINGDLAPRSHGCMGKKRPGSLERACENFLLPLSGLCQIIFSLGNHELQNPVSFYNLLSFLKIKNIPFLTHISGGIAWDKLVEEYNDWRSISKITLDDAVELQANIFPYRIIENTLFVSYCSSFLVYGGGLEVGFLKEDYREALKTLHRGRNSRDNLPPSAEDHLITRIIRENFQRAITDLARIPGPINIVIAAHEFYHPSDNVHDRVRGIWELILRDIAIPREVLNRLTWTIVCGHEHLQYHYQDQSLTIKNGTVQYDVIGTTVHDARVPDFAIMAFKPTQSLPIARPGRPVAPLPSARPAALLPIAGPVKPVVPLPPARPAALLPSAKPAALLPIAGPGRPVAPLPPARPAALLPIAGPVKPVAPLPPARPAALLPIARPGRPITYKGPYKHKAMPDGSRHAGGKNRLLERPRTWKPASIKPTLPVGRSIFPAGKPTLRGIKPTWPVGRPTLSKRKPSFNARRSMTKTCERLKYHRPHAYF
jgi:hypothetical protein